MEKKRKDMRRRKERGGREIRKGYEEEGEDRKGQEKGEEKIGRKEG